MIDAHIHIEKSPYTLEYIMQYVNQALTLGLDEINLLEHTHRFKEWAFLYEDAINSSSQMKQWFNQKELISIQDYHQFILKMRQLDLPIKVNFGLEVCYFKEKESFIHQMLSLFNYDFVIGSVHHVYHLAYDFNPISLEILWHRYSIDDIYKTYYNSVKDLIKSHLFTQIGHMDTIKLFNLYPSYDLIPTYHEIADLLIKHQIIVECNSGCFYRYHHQDLGLNETLLKILIDHGVNIVTSSDAHTYQDVGKYIKEMSERIKVLKETSR